MNPNREEALFELALEKPAEKRAAFLDAMCEGDTALRARLEALLAAHEQTEGVLAEPAPAAKATLKLELTDTPDESIGQVIGRYKVLRKIVEGGTDKSYGIHVARLAGVPKEVLERAKQILANLEESELTPEGNVRPQTRQRGKLKDLAPAPQMDLFG